MKDRTRYDLNKQSIAAAELIREIGSDDAELTHDMVEGETDLFEAIEAALAEIDQCDILASGLQSHILELQKRLSRIKNRAKAVRGLIDQAFQMAEIESHVFPTATITLKSVPAKLIVTDEAQIPSRFFEPQPPKLDKKELTKAAKAGDVAGVTMSNGGKTIQIRRA